MKGHIERLKAVPGLVDVRPLEGTQRDIVLNLESENNIGVLECLRRRYVLVVVHDESFRDPHGQLVVVQGEGLVFPPLPFPELEAENVISGSPSKDAHDFLRREFGWDDEILATILIGFD